MKRILSSFVFVLLFLAGCSDPDRMPVITGAKLNSVGGISFSEDRKAMTNIVLTASYVNPASKRVEISNVHGSIFSQEGTLVATVSIPAGDVIAFEAGTEGEFTATVIVRLEGSVLKLVFSGGLEALETGTLDIEADVKYGGYRKHFSKSGIPVEEMMKNFRNNPEDRQTI